ncbi:Dextranase [Symbiodinium necroappetens]|uniref:Dextranase protein n=1 Tax=Symbiodinium necroappetens TaxID=1628268 RepID=A0A812RXH4_9DINO|nr:Dextranase [Symbiodinium necroappetens]
MRRLLVVALHSLALHAESDSEPGFEYYAGAAGPWSSEFQVTLHHAGRSVQPHVYGISVPSDRRDGPEPADRSTSWVEFAQPCNQSVTVVEVVRMKKPFPKDVHIRPKRYGIHLQLSDDAHTVSFAANGCGKHISVHYGSVFVDANSSKYNLDSSTHDAMLVFVSEPAPPVDPAALVIPPGEHHVGQGGVLNVSCEVSKSTPSSSSLNPWTR